MKNRVPRSPKAGSLDVCFSKEPPLLRSFDIRGRPVREKLFFASGQEGPEAKRGKPTRGVPHYSGSRL
jgi:hypothetical protein